MNIRLFKNDIPDDLTIEGDLGIDTEAMGLNISRDRLCLIQISNDNNGAYLIQFESDYRAPNLKKLLLNSNTAKIFHFARFDLAIIKQYLGISLENIFCTKIASYLSRTYTDSHSLRNVCKDLLGQNLSKKQTSSDWGKKTLSQQQQKYATSDVIHLPKIRDILTDMLKRENRLDLAKKIFSFLNVRVELDLLGWKDCDIFAHSQVRKC